MPSSPPGPKPSHCISRGDQRRRRVEPRGARPASLHPRTGERAHHVHDGRAVGDRARPARRDAAGTGRHGGAATECGRRRRMGRRPGLTGRELPPATDEREDERGGHDASRDTGAFVMNVHPPRCSLMPFRVSASSTRLMVSHSGAAIAASPPVAITAGVPFISSARRRTSASTWPAAPQITPAWSDSSVVRPSARAGRRSSTRGRRAARRNSSSAEVATPGRDHAAQVGALRARCSRTWSRCRGRRRSPACRRSARAATAFAIRSAPTARLS